MNAIFQLLNPSNTVTVNRPLAHAIGLMETVIYGALVSKWNYYAEQGKLDDGWFYSTAADLEESTALTERQQKRCIDNLVELGLIKCEKRCMPAKRGFYIIDDIVLLAEYVALGEKKMETIKPQSAKKTMDRIQRRNREKAEISKTENPENTSQPASQHCPDKTSGQVPTKCRDKSLQNVGTSTDKTSEQVPTKCRNSTLLYNRPPRKLPKRCLTCLFCIRLCPFSLKYIQYSCGKWALPDTKNPASFSISPVPEDV